MNLYVIERIDPIDYDEYKGHVVQARTIDNAYELVNTKNCNKYNSTCNIIGTNNNISERIILSSYRAG